MNNLSRKTLEKFSVISEDRGALQGNNLQSLLEQIKIHYALMGDEERDAKGQFYYPKAFSLPSIRKQNCHQSLYKAMREGNAESC